MQSGDDSLWESFPHVLESLEGARRYISAFQAPLQELSALSPAQIHTLRACSLLAIPPPPERVPPQGGFPTDLLELNLLGWAALVQDVAAGLQALPPNLGRDMGLPAVALLQLLEVSTGVGFCCYCCSPGSQCKCVEASQPVPPASWSQIVEQTPGYGVIASSGGMTTPSTSVAGMPGYVVPPPGLTPPDFSSWSLPPLEAPPPQGLPAALQSLSRIGRSIQVRAAVERQARAQLVQGPRGLSQPAQTQPTPAPFTPQMAPPVCQPPPGQPATLYQQAVQPPGKSTGRGVTFDPYVDKTAPAGGPSSQDCGRPITRGWGDGGRSVSCPRWVQEKTSMQPPRQEGDLPSGSTPNVPPPTAPERTLPQPGGQRRTSPRDPARLAAKYHSVGWKKDLEHVLRVYYKYNAASFKEAEWVRLRNTFFTHFLPHKEEALGIKERCPMDYMPYIEEHFWRATGLHLNGLRDFTAWIKSGSYYHGLVAQQGHLHKCPHLAGVPLPRRHQVTPSESHRESQKKAETPPTSSSEPSVGATVAPVVETPAARSDTPAPMETGGAGDSQSWAECVVAGIDEEFQKDRPAKRRRSQSRRRKERPTLPFPLQDSERRLASISQLYKHAGEQPAACHNVAGRGIMHLHPQMLPHEATRLGNQVVCMIAEYHLTGSARGPSSLSTVLPEAATTLLPPIKDYVPGVTFEGTRDVRVVDHARTL